jgi:hypothetical protein
MGTELRLNKDMALRSHEELTQMSKIPYGQLIGKMIYAVVGTRFDIVFAVSTLQEFISNDGKDNLKTANDMQRHLNVQSILD